MEKRNRPVDLPLLKIRLPMGGIVSIVHRITGVLLVLALPASIYWWDRSLASETGFIQATEFLGSTGAKILCLLLAAVFIQHLVSGLRHLLLDLHIGIDKISARSSARAVPVITFVLVAVVAAVMFL